MKHRLLLLLPALALTTLTVARADDAAPDSAAPNLAAPSPATTSDAAPPIFLPPQLIFAMTGPLDAAFSGKINRRGEVDYPQLKGDKNLAAYVAATAQADIAAFPVISTVPVIDNNADGTGRTSKVLKPIVDRSAELTFLINAYNAHILKTLSDAYPINSPDEVRDLDSAKTHNVGGKIYSLAELRARITALDPRAVFALTDGTKGGPLLNPAPYSYSSIDQLLDLAARNFISDPRNSDLLRIQNQVTVSDFLIKADPLFKPRAARRDWDGIRFLLQTYTDTHANRSYYNTGDFSVSFKKADRSLNNKIVH